MGFDINNVSDEQLVTNLLNANPRDGKWTKKDARACVRYVRNYGIAEAAEEFGLSSSGLWVQLSCYRPDGTDPKGKRKSGSRKNGKSAPKRSSKRSGSITAYIKKLEAEMEAVRKIEDLENQLASALRGRVSATPLRERQQA